MLVGKLFPVVYILGLLLGLSMTFGVADLLDSVLVFHNLLRKL